MHEFHAIRASTVIPHMSTVCMGSGDPWKCSTQQTEDSAYVRLALEYLFSIYSVHAFISRFFISPLLCAPLRFTVEFSSVALCGSVNQNVNAKMLTKINLERFATQQIFIWITCHVCDVCIL